MPSAMSPAWGPGNLGTEAEFFSRWGILPMKAAARSLKESAWRSERLFAAESEPFYRLHAALSSRFDAVN